MTGLAKKLQIKGGARVLILNAPSGYIHQLNDLPDNTILHTSLYDGCDVVQWFVKNKAQASSEANDVLASISPNTVFWACYPKKSSKLKSDISRDEGWGSLIDAGFRGVAAISIDDDWSGLRFRKQEEVKAKSSNMSDQAVEAKTGKNWNDWFAQLDGIEGKTLSHKELVAYLSTKHEIDGWWCQMITNTYEQYIGRRQKHQQGKTFEISVSKTIAVPIEILYQSFVDPEKRKQWLADYKFEISTANENRSIRAKWVDSKTRISLEFYSKGENKSQIVVQHLKLESKGIAEAHKLYWKDQLSGLIKFLS